MKMRWILGLLALLTLPAHAQQSVRYIHTDGLGSVVAVTDGSRNVIERREYEPFGEQLTPTVQDGPGYTGHVQDAVTGLTYMQQRYYDPVIGRFLSVDPVTAYHSGDMRHFNRHAYAYNNPYKFTDPDGRSGRERRAEAFGTLAITALELTGKIDAKTAERMRASVSGNVRARRSQRAASREAKREVGIPTSQQASSQTNGRAPDGTPVGRQQSYEVPKAGGGTETKSVQVSRDTRGAHAGMPQVEAGTVKPGGQADVAGRPRIQNEDKVRVDFDRKK